MFKVTDYAALRVKTLFVCFSSRFGDRERDKEEKGPKR